MLLGIVYFAIIAIGIACIVGICMYLMRYMDIQYDPSWTESEHQQRELDNVKL